MRVHPVLLSVSASHVTKQASLHFCESLVSATHLTGVSTVVGQTWLQQPQSLEEAAASPMASRRQLLLTCPSNSGGCALRMPPSLRNIIALWYPYLLQGSSCQTPWMFSSLTFPCPRMKCSTSSQSNPLLFLWFLSRFIIEHSFSNMQQSGNLSLFMVL